MTDIALETSRSIIIVTVFFHLLINGRKEKIHEQNCWSYILIGFAFLFFGMVIDITDNFLNVNKYIIISDTGYEGLFEKAIGYLCGLLLVAIGFWKWIPAVITAGKTDEALKESQDELKLKVIRRTAELVASNNELESKVKEHRKTEKELMDSIAKVKMLSGTLPICSTCKRIRDDKGYWEQIEVYIQNHSDAEFSHALCPECAKGLYPEYFKEKK